MTIGKKGDGGAISLLMKVAISLLVLFILVYGVVPKISSMVKSSSECSEKNNAICVEAGSSCPDNGYETSAFTCSDKTNTCCQLSSSSKSDPAIARFSTKERQALQNAIIVSTDVVKTPVSELSFKEGVPSTINIKFDSGLPKDTFGPVALFAVDTSDPTDTKYWLNDGAQPVDNVLCSSISVLEQSSNCKPGGTVSFSYTPKLQDSYRDLKYNIIVLDKIKIVCTARKTGTSVISKTITTDQEFLDCLKPKNDEEKKSLSDQFNAILVLSTELNNYLYDPEFWLASKKLNIKVTRTLDITGVSTNWVAEDTFSVVSTDKTLENLRIALFDATENGAPMSLNDRVALCSDTENTNFLFTSEYIKNIAGLTEDKGIKFNINLGGFNLGNTNNPSSSLDLKYTDKDVPLSFINGKADIKIDKVALNNFADAQPGNKLDYLKSQTLYICARADKKIGSGASQKIVTYSAISSTPLKVDIIPPEVTKDDIRIIMPDPVYNFKAAATYESVKGQPYYYTQYPHILINCQDSQSGCASYDYFMKTGNFVDVKVDSPDVQTVIIGTILQFGLNALLQKMGASDPVDKLCPHLLSSDYRSNTRNIINFKEEGQAYVCVRVKDKAGNSQLVWTAVWSPQNFLKKVAYEAINEELNSTQTTTK